MVPIFYLAHSFSFIFDVLLGCRTKNGTTPFLLLCSQTTLLLLCIYRRRWFGRDRDRGLLLLLILLSYSCSAVAFSILLLVASSYDACRLRVRQSFLYFPGGDSHHTNAPVTNQRTVDAILHLPPTAISHSSPKVSLSWPNILSFSSMDRKMGLSTQIMDQKINEHSPCRRLVIMNANP